MTAVVVVDPDTDPQARWLPALAAQTAPLSRLIVVNRTGRDLGELADPAGAAGVGLAGTVVYDVSASPRLPLRRVVGMVLERFSEELGPLADDEALWLLTSATEPEPPALEKLVVALGSSRNVGVAGPMLVRRDAPRRVLHLGLQSTRLGRVVPNPAPGTVDQGQFDERLDALAVPLEGMLVRRRVLTLLGGFDPALGLLAADLDLGWRAQAAGQRVVVVPRARVRVANRTGHPTDADRRRARQIALARTPWWQAPLAGLWVMLSALVVAAGLLLVKQPHLARRELVSAAGVIGLPAILRARWRRRRAPDIGVENLAPVLVPPQAAWEDLVERARPGRAPRPNDPTSRAAEEPHPSGLGNPAVWAALLAGVMAAVAGRQVTGGLLSRFDTGLAGGELLGVRADAADYVRTWLQAWNGSGWGSPLEASPAHLVLALPAWLVGLLPGSGAIDSPIGAVVALLFTLALPLAALTFHHAAAVLTRSGVARAIGALAWASSAAAVAAVAQGRLGPVVALVLLPPLAAGLLRLSSPSGGRMSTAATTALLAALVGAFVPSLLVAVLLAALVPLLRGPGPVRLRALVVLAVPPLLLGPWLTTLALRPQEVLAGMGAAQWGPAAPLWRLALGDPGGAGTTVGASIPLVLVGGAALLFSRRRGALLWVAGLTALLGLTASVLAPRLALARIPAGAPGTGEVITPWPGVGALLLTLGLISAALVAGGQERTRRSWAAVAGSGVVVLAVVALNAWTSFGAQLQPWRDPQPAVAIDGAEGPAAQRQLAITIDGEDARYAVLGREPGPPARSLPASPADPSSSMAGAVAAVLGLGDAGSTPPARVFAEHGVAFLSLGGDATPAQRARLDAVDGLSRSGLHHGTTTWRVRFPGGQAGADAVPARLRVTNGRSDTVLPATGLHGQAHGTLTVPPDATLVVAAPRGWAAHATVSVDGVPVAADARSSAPTYPLPAGRHEISVVSEIGHPWWKLLAAAVLLTTLFLALPVSASPGAEEDA